MQPDRTQETIKQGPTRSVRRTTAGEVIKRFERADSASGDGPAVDPPRRLLRDRFAVTGRWDVRRRAKREFAVLSYLHSRGVNVPEPRLLRRVEGGWEVTMEEVRNAQPLKEYLVRAPESPPGGWRSVLERLGTGLADLHRAGLDHPDLHPGNALIGPAGEVTWVDFHQARRRARPAAAVWQRDLIRATGALRDYLPVRLRRRALRAWRAAVDAFLPGLEDPRFWSTLEELARSERRRRVEQGAGRWLRDSSRGRWIEADGLAIWLRHGLDHGDRAAGEIVLQGDPQPRVRWLACARLKEHAVPCAVPRLWDPDSNLATFDEPVRRIAGSRAEAARKLEEALHQRGLRSESPLEVLGDADRGWYLAPPRGLGRKGP